jgi:hypothetical protein
LPHPLASRPERVAAAGRHDGAVTATALWVLGSVVTTADVRSEASPSSTCC